MDALKWNDGRSEEITEDVDFLSLLLIGEHMVLDVLVK